MRTKIMGLLVVCAVTLVSASQPVKQSELTRLPDGEWQSNANRDAVVKIKGNTIIFSSPETKTAPVVEGEYTITQDHLVYGVVTRTKFADEELGLLFDMVDETFSFRYRVDGDRLIIKDLKLHYQGRLGEFVKLAKVSGKSDENVLKSKKEAERLLTAMLPAMRLAWQGDYTKMTNAQIKKARRKLEGEKDRISPEVPPPLPPPPPLFILYQVS